MIRRNIVKVKMMLFLKYTAFALIGLAAAFVKN